jgi:hypothetical protein
MSTDEMGSITLHVVAAREADTVALRDALKEQVADMVIDRALTRPRRNPMVKAMFERFDKNGDGQIDAAERPDLRGFIKDQGWLPGGLNNSF